MLQHCTFRQFFLVILSGTLVYNTIFWRKMRKTYTLTNQKLVNTHQNAYVLAPAFFIIGILRFILISFLSLLLMIQIYSFTLHLLYNIYDIVKKIITIVLSYIRSKAFTQHWFQRSRFQLKKTAKQLMEKALLTSIPEKFLCHHIWNLNVIMMRLIKKKR